MGENHQSFVSYCKNSSNASKLVWTKNPLIHCFVIEFFFLQSSDIEYAVVASRYFIGDLRRKFFKQTLVVGMTQLEMMKLYKDLVVLHSEFLEKYYYKKRNGQWSDETEQDYILNQKIEYAFGVMDFYAVCWYIILTFAYTYLPREKQTLCLMSFQLDCTLPTSSSISHSSQFKLLCCSLILNEWLMVAWSLRFCLPVTGNLYCSLF